MPRAVLDGPLGHAANTGYGWRMNRAYAPRRVCLSDVAAPLPFRLIAGAADDSFRAEACERPMSAATRRRRGHVPEDPGHPDVVDTSRTETLLRAALDAP